jgi:hypothetical protein
MEQFEYLKNKFSHIKGWGIDADPDNEPTYPIKDYTGDDHLRLGWERPELQKSNVEILKSNERPYLTSSYGTPNPPAALSGMIRRRAFKYSESSYGHWLPLFLADRVNVVEGIFADIRKGHFPNIWKEKGFNAEWKLNPKGIVRRLIVGIIITTVIVSAVRRKRSKI